MVRASIEKVNADAELPPLGPFSAEAELAGAWSSALVLIVLVIGLSLAALVAIVAAASGGRRVSAGVSLSRQISALNAEVEIRRRETEREVRAGRMKPSERDYVIASLEAAADTLRRIEAKRDLINQRTWNGDVAPVGGCW